ncbi:MAG: RNA polymerase sigma factor [Flavobacteriales bacterium]|nr:RNA polymerase sigma factor [Flavobacteriales bacterium]
MDPDPSVHVPSDGELVQGCLHGDRRYQELLYSRYNRRMFGVCLRYARHRSEAMDLLQDGFVKVFQNLHRFRNEGALEGWIRRIMVNTAISLCRQRAFKDERLGMDHMPEGPIAPEAFDKLSEQDLLRLVQGLPEGYRLVFNLYAIEGYDHAEIATLLGCGESTSRSQLAKARRHLQEKLERISERTHERLASDR